ncbi:DNA replication protein DnaC [Weissella oryzae SG25]|uniref:DNA replication protein DnaC n=1 Tax=Weissella oryzae (strain DSM 25784 / JCM 18191 / LMG 30913 / SG25) TaxID=1329250 RepID=A0A069CWT9_WEIOS|nr:ATP-binding protein [Weissella oryzae]GAK31822.1 DNA replication protein DnaC [Weissella oryzae SG25]
MNDMDKLAAVIADKRGKRQQMLGTESSMTGLKEVQKRLVKERGLDQSVIDKASTPEALAKQERQNSIDFTEMWEAKKRQALSKYDLWADTPLLATINDFDPAIQASNIIKAQNIKQAVREIGNRYFKGATENIVFFGPPGVGKTLLMSGLFNGLRKKGMGVLFVSAVKLYELKQLSMDSKQQIDRDKFNNILRATREAEVLFLDDLGSELQDGKTNAMVSSYMRQIAESRTDKATVISTNDKRVTIAQKYGDATASRLYSQNPERIVDFTGLKDLRNR